MELFKVRVLVVKMVTREKRGGTWGLWSLSVGCRMFG